MMKNYFANVKKGCLNSRLFLPKAIPVNAVFP
jgi:hypothetical protein